LGLGLGSAHQVGQCIRGNKGNGHGYSAKNPHLGHLVVGLSMTLSSLCLDRRPVVISGTPATAA